jgi:outer membrane receptor protein involved in Fe transport
LCVGAPARAQPQGASFDVPAGDLSRSLLLFAAQAHVSIGLAPGVACGATLHGLAGRYEIEEGLNRLLAGTGCGFRRIDGGAYFIIATPRPAPRPSLAAPVPLPLEVGEVVVTATRRPVLTSRLAYAVSIAPSTELAQQGIADAGGLALTIPAMTVTNLGAGRDKIVLRGLSDGPLTGRTQSTVGIYLDDVRLTYNAPDPDLRLVDIAQVEVLRGPQGALYGSGSLGGVVHLVTNAPDPRAYAAWISATGSVGRGDPSSVLEAMLNLPTPWGGGAARMVAYAEDDGGYIDDPGQGRRSVNRTIRAGYRFALSQPVGADWSLSAGVVGQGINARDTQYAFAGTKYVRRNAIAEPHDNDFRALHLGAAGDLGWADARVSLANLRHRIDSRYDATSAPPAAAPPGPLAFDDDDDISSLVGEATIAAKPGARLQWLAGGFLARTSQHVSLALHPDGRVDLSVFGEDRRERLVEAALFGEATIPIGKRLSLTAGGRLFTVRSRVTSLITAAAPASPMDFAGRVAATGFAPKLVLAYQQSADLLIYVQAAEGYRAPGLNTTGAPGQAFSDSGDPPPARVYGEDELWSFEAGARARWLDGRIVLRAAAFDAVWKNIQSDQLLPSGLPFTANIGDGSIIGFELEGSYRQDALTVQTALMLNRPELDSANPALPTRLDLSLAGVPHVSGSIVAHYEWPISEAASLSLDGRIAYVGPSRLTFDAQSAPKMGGYFTARLAATFASGGWRLTGAVDNPTDTYANTFAYGNPFTLRTTRQVTPLRPRTASLTVSRAF